MSRLNRLLRKILKRLCLRQLVFQPATRIHVCRIGNRREEKNFAPCARVKCIKRKTRRIKHRISRDFGGIAERLKQHRIEAASNAVLLFELGSARNLILLLVFVLALLTKFLEYAPPFFGHISVQYHALPDC